MSNLVFSQVGYPKKVVIGKDTVVAITDSQVKYLNLIHLDLSICRELNDSLLKKIQNDSLLIIAQKNYNQSIFRENEINKNILKNTQDINLQLNKDLNKTVKLYNRQRFKLGFLGGISVILTGTIVTLLIIK